LCKEADLILLERNPLEDIRNTRTIKAVYTHDKFYSREQLDKLLNEVKIIAGRE
jgi:hypothetical protein